MLCFLEILHIQFDKSDKISSQTYLHLTLVNRFFHRGEGCVEIRMKTDPKHLVWLERVVEVQGNKPT